MAIDIDGTTVVMTRWEALIRQVYIMAHSNPSAARLLHKVRQQFPGTGVSGVKSVLVFTDNEMKY